MRQVKQYNSLRFLKLGIFSLFAFVVFSCKTTKIEAPAASYQTKPITLQQSTIPIFIDIDILTIEKMLNDNIKGLIYEDNNIEDDNMKVKAWKSKDFKVRCNNNAFLYSVPLKLWINAGWKANPLGISLADYKEFNAEIQLDFKTSLSINEKWEVLSHTSIENYHWVNKPTIKIGTFNIPITTVANALLNYNRQTFVNKIDTSIKKLAPLRQYAQALWEQSQAPFEISKEYKTSVKSTPTKIYGTPLICSANKVTMSIMLDLNVETYTGQTAPVTKINKALPSYKSITTASPEFKINLASQIDYPVIDSLAKTMLIGQTFSEGKYSVTILGLDFYGNENKLIASVELKGSFNGNVYFSGVPYYEKRTKTIQLNNFDFDFNTKNTLLKSSKWLLKGPFKSLIASKMKFPISMYLEQMKTNLKPYLSKISIHNNVALHCDLKEIDINDIFLTQPGLKIATSFNGVLSLKVK